MKSFFTHKQIPHNLRKGHVLSLPPTRPTYYGTNSVHLRGYFIWNNLPSHIKSSSLLGEFKNNLKNFRDIYWWCSICRYSILVYLYIYIYICIYMLFFIIIIIIRTIVCGWFLLAMSYFTVSTFNKVVNK